MAQKISNRIPPLESMEWLLLTVLIHVYNEGKQKMQWKYEQFTVSQKSSMSGFKISDENACKAVIISKRLASLKRNIVLFH